MYFSVRLVQSKCTDNSMKNLFERKSFHNVGSIWALHVNLLKEITARYFACSAKGNETVLSCFLLSQFACNAATTKREFKIPFPFTVLSTLNINNLLHNWITNACC